MTSDCAKWRGDMQNLRRLLLYNVMKSLVDDSPQEDYFDRVTSPTQVSEKPGPVIGFDRVTSPTQVSEKPGSLIGCGRS